MASTSIIVLRFIEISHHLLQFASQNSARATTIIAPVWLHVPQLLLHVPQQRCSEPFRRRSD